MIEWECRMTCYNRMMNHNIIIPGDIQRTLFITMYRNKGPVWWSVLPHHRCVTYFEIDELLHQLTPSLVWNFHGIYKFIFCSVFGTSMPNTQMHRWMKAAWFFFSVICWELSIVEKWQVNWRWKDSDYICTSPTEIHLSATTSNGTKSVATSKMRGISVKVTGTDSHLRLYSALWRFW